MTNDLPQDAPDVIRITEKAYSIVSDLKGRPATGSEKEIDEEIEKEYGVQIKRLGPKAREFVGPSDPDHIKTARQRYDLLASAQRTLLGIAGVNSKVISDHTPGIWDQLFKAKSGVRVTKDSLRKGWKERGSFWLYFDKHFPLVDLALDDEGKFILKHHKILEAIEGVEAFRIRQCPICQRIYWAGRLDQLACSKQCNQTRRARAWRKSYSTKYKLQRIKKATEAEQQSLKTSKVPRKRSKSIK